eukprot:4021268-Pyramimonas_sp.AAC.1
MAKILTLQITEYFVRLKKTLLLGSSLAPRWRQSAQVSPSLACGPDSPERLRRRGASKTEASSVIRTMVL